MPAASTDPAWLPYAVVIPTGSAPQWRDLRSSAAGLHLTFLAAHAGVRPALFPSFDAGVPELAPLPPLRNENDARAALTEPSSFYFLDDSGLLGIHAASKLHVASCGDRRPEASAAAV